MINLLFKSLGSIFNVLCFCFVVSQLTFSQQYWLRQQSPVTAWLKKCSFTDTLNGWAGGDSGVIIHTSNGGLNWTQQSTGVIDFIEDIYFVNKNSGWAISNDYYYNTQSRILKTSNGGLNWSSFLFPDTVNLLFTIYFPDTLNGWIGGFGGVIYQTTNAGANWLRRLVDSSESSTFPIHSFEFCNAQYGFASGGYFDIAGVIWRTTNFGLNWSSEFISPEPINDMHCFDLSRIIGAGGDFEYGASTVRTSNGGLNWTWENLNIFGAAQRIAFRTPAEVWMPLGFALKWALSTDSANTFTEIEAPDTSAIWDAVFVTPLHGWAVGSAGAVYKYNSGLIGIEKNVLSKLPTRNMLYQNFPNPFNPETTIKFYLVNGSRVKLTVYDLLGRELKVLFDGIKKAGEHSINFSSNELPSGIYFYTVQSENYFESKKMVVLR